MYDSRIVASFLLELAKEKDNGALTPMQLLKLVYIAHGWMLGLCSKPLIEDEVQAWQYGPVIPRLYDAVRSYRGEPVTKPFGIKHEDFAGYAKSITEKIFELYNGMNGLALSRLTHAVGTPWHQVYKPGVFGSVIPDDLIAGYYARRVRGLRSSSQ